MQAFRILQSQGIGSRQECQHLIQQRQVLFNGELVTNPKQELACQHLTFQVGGTFFHFYSNVYLIMNKPAGYECSRQPRDHVSVFSLLPNYLLRRGVQCVGRLDQDTTGLLLFSDDGGFIHELTSPKKHIGKTYQVTCKHAVAHSMVEKLLSGVQLHDQPAPLRAYACRALSEYQLVMTIQEGKYHQVKRMIAAAGNRVEALHRQAIGGCALPANLAPGSWQWLAEPDLAALKTAV